MVSCPTCGQPWTPRYDAWGAACGVCGAREQTGFQAPSAGFAPQQEQPAPGSLIAQKSDPRTMAEIFAQFDAAKVQELTPDHPDVLLVVGEYRAQRVKFMAEQAERRRNKKERLEEEPKEKKALDVSGIWGG